LSIEVELDIEEEMGESTLTIMRGILAKNAFFYKGAGVCMSALNDRAVGDE
jgi:hypothetical protein